MSNEDFMQLVLNELKSLKEGQENLIEVQENLVEGQKTLEKNFSILEQGQKALEENFSNLEQGQKNLESEVARIRESVANIEMNHGKHLGMLSDGYALMLDKLEPIPDAVEALQEDVAVIKAVITKNSTDIKTLKVAK